MRWAGGGAAGGRGRPRSLPGDALGLAVRRRRPEPREGESGCRRPRRSATGNSPESTPVLWGSPRGPGVCVGIGLVPRAGSAVPKSPRSRAGLRRLLAFLQRLKAIGAFSVSWL